MSDEASQVMQAVLDLERALIQLHSRVGVLERHRVAGVEQGLAALWSLQLGGVCVTTLQGRARGGTGVLPGATVKLVGSTTGIDYGTFTADGSGLWTAALELNSADATLDAFVGGFSPRLDDTFANTVNFTPCDVNDWSTEASLDLQARPASGYAYWRCNLPIAGALTVVDSVQGTGTTTEAGGTWQACLSFTSQATGSCPTAVATVLKHFIFATGATQFGTFVTLSGGCPVATSNCSLAGSAFVSATTPTSLTCPTTGAPGFSVTYTFSVGAGNAQYPAGTVTVTFHE